jgi:predicted amidohydrolase YtcJ
MIRPFVLAAALLAGAAAQAETADYVFRNATVYTVDAARPWARAVAVRDKKIIHVGADDAASLQPYIDKQTKVVDLGGKMLLPGFIDAHVHPILASFVTAGAELQVPTHDAMMQVLARYAKEHPTGPVWGFGWRTDMFGPEGPTKEELDRIFPDRPAFMVNIDFHSIWVNSKALAAAKIGRDTPDPLPDFSYYHRDASGEPTGYAVETQTMLTLIAAVVPVTPQLLAGYLGQWMPKASAAGLTALFDAGVPPIGDQGDMVALYSALERQGQLPVRVTASYNTRSPHEAAPVPKLLAMRERLTSELLEIGALKILGDGTEGGFTAVLLEPYADKPDTSGTPPFTQVQLNAVVRDADAAGVDVHVHCDGDGCTRMSLNAIEAAMQVNPQRDRRHTICHLVTIDPADLPRFARLGVIAQVGVNWASADPDSNGTLLSRLGPERHSHNVYRARSLIASGARVTFATDWAAAGYFSTYKPLDVIQIGMTRQLLDKPDGPVLAPASERLDLAQMIKGYTLDVAYQLRLDRQVGSLEVGKLADFVVLEKNLFDVDPHDIHKVEVLATMMNGRFTHGDADALAREGRGDVKN